MYMLHSFRSLGGSADNCNGDHDHPSVDGNDRVDTSDNYPYEGTGNGLDTQDHNSDVVYTNDEFADDLFGIDNSISIHDVHDLNNGMDDPDFHKSLVSINDTNVDDGNYVGGVEHTHDHDGDNDVDDDDYNDIDVDDYDDNDVVDDDDYDDNDVDDDKNVDDDDEYTHYDTNDNSQMVVMSDDIKYSEYLFLVMSGLIHIIL